MALRLFVALTCLLAVAGCTRNRDLTTDIKLVDVQSGWLSAVAEDGRNKIVPSVSVKIQNVSNEPISGVQLNAIFRRVGETEVWGEHFIQGIERTAPLDAGVTGKALVLRSTLGYTGDESREKMLGNREFVDTFVRVFGKHGSRTWVQLGEFQIERRLLSESTRVPTPVSPNAAPAP